MKAIQKVLAIVILTGAVEVGMGNARAATNDVSGLLQQGLLEEEVNRNLDAAIQDYQSVVSQTEKDRKFEATAIFRLGECYRKLGRTNEANAQYQRIVSDFDDQADLVTLSRGYLGTATVVAATAPANVAQVANGPEEEELRRIQTMLQDSPDLINGAPGQEPPLVHAVEQNFVKVATYLLEHHADVNRVGQIQGHPIYGWEGCSAINVAAREGNLALVELLLEHRADINDTAAGTEADGRSRGNLAPLHWAAKNGYQALAEFLLAHKADVNLKTASGLNGTPLHFAAQNGYRSIAELLLANGADVNAQNSLGNTPLDYAVNKNFPEVVDLLIAHKANVNAVAKDGTTPLIESAESGSLESARILVAHGADVNAKKTSEGDTGWSPLAFAVHRQPPDVALVKFLLENHADANFKDPTGKTLLMTASENKNADIARLLLDHGADVNAAMPDMPAFVVVTTSLQGVPPQNQLSRSQWRALHFAIEAEANDVVELLLQHEADPNATINGFQTKSGGMFPGQPGALEEIGGTTPLLLAEKRNNDEAARILLAHHADPNLSDDLKLTPLIQAAENGDTNLVALLLQDGADVNAQQNGQTVLDIAIQNNSVDTVKLLLEHKPKLDAVSAQVLTPLQSAVLYSSVPASAARVSIVRMLLEAGADPNPPIPPGHDFFGSTPLELAVTRPNLLLTKALLDHGADPNYLDKSGNTALSFAYSMLSRPGFDQKETVADIIAALKKAGASENVQRLQTISLAHDEFANPSVVFPKITNTLNHFTLMDLIVGRFFELAGENAVPLPGWEFPDFGRIRISRLDSGDRTNIVKVDLATALAAGDCPENVPLQWGDIVEIPEADHPVSAVWDGLGGDVVKSLVKCGTRNVIVVIKGQSNGLALTPRFFNRQTGVNYSWATQSGHMTYQQRLEEQQDAAFVAGSQMRSEYVKLPFFWLQPALENSGLLLTSSDLSRVTVRRLDPATVRTVNMTFDLSSGQSGTNDLWLRDGDVIEVPEKE